MFVWSYLTRGDAAYTLVQVAVNDIIMLFAFAPIVMLPLGLSDIAVPWDTVALSVVLYIVIPLTIRTSLFFFNAYGWAKAWRVGAGVIMRPRANAGTPGARPICPQCGFDLTEVPAEASGRTTCPGCERTWAFGRDRAVWREEGPERRVGTPSADVDGPIPFPGTRSDKRSRPAARRSRRKARRQAATFWTCVLVGYLVALWAVLPLGNLLAPVIGIKVLAYAGLAALTLLPLAIAAAGVRAVVRAGRDVAAQPCPSCGYDLTGLDRTKVGGAACPECGARV